MVGFRRRRKKPRRHLVHGYLQWRNGKWRRIRAHFRGRKKRR